MANIPGLFGTIMPQVVTRVRTMQRALSVPGGLRILGITGEGQREEIVVDSAVGNNEDGFNPTFTAQSDGYGRYFRLSTYPIVSNRTTLLLNDAPLRLVEDTIDSATFSSEYDARIEIATGKIELQRAALVDLGGINYQISSANAGDGYLSSLTLLDTNAPGETWTIRCSSVLRDGYGNPRRYQASFIASGTVSGQIRDAYGQPYIWKSDGVVVSNGILSFAVENPINDIVDVGDKFTVEVNSGVLVAGDNLEARYIATADLNDPTSYTDPEKLFQRFGTPSETNTLSLGAQMAFENGATSVLAQQAKPPLPRRTSEIVLAGRDTVTGIGGATGNATADDLIFYVTAPGKPDTDTEVHFFTINTDGTETQIFPNKVTFYDPDITTAFSTYETTGVSTSLMSTFMNPSLSGNVYSYTVVTDDKIAQTGTDGSIAPIGGGSTATFYSASAAFTLSVVGKYIDFYNATNAGRYEITAITDAHTVTISRVVGSFTTETSVKWQLLDATGDAQRVLFTTDLALAAGKGLRVSYIDNKDVDFFDANWSDTLDKWEVQSVQILVALPTQTYSAIQQAYRVHVERMSTTYYKRERMLLMGAINGLTVDNVTGVSLAAVEDVGVLEGIQGDSAQEILDANIEDLSDYSVSTSFGDTFRVMYFYPDQIVRAINGTNTTLSGYWMAAAAGGWLAGQPNIALPLTNKILVGFTIPNTRIFKETQLNSLAAAGCCVAQPVTGGARILWGKTTTQSGTAEEEEASIVFIRDQIARTFRSVMQNFIGTPSDPTLIPSITAKAISILNSFVSQGLINRYRNLSVARDSVEPRQYNVVVEIEPSYPTNWIFVDISVGMF